MEDVDNINNNTTMTQNDDQGMVDSDNPNNQNMSQEEQTTHEPHHFQANYTPASSDKFSTGKLATNVYVAQSVADTEIENFWINCWLDPGFEKSALQIRFPHLMNRMQYPFAVVSAKQLQTPNGMYPEIYHRQGLNACAIAVIGTAVNMADAERVIRELGTMNAHVCNTSAIPLGSRWNLMTAPNPDIVNMPYFRDIYFKRMCEIVRAYAAIMNETKEEYLKKVHRTAKHANDTTQREIALNIHEYMNGFEDVIESSKMHLQKQEEMFKMSRKNKRRRQEETQQQQDQNQEQQQQHHNKAQTFSTEETDSQQKMKVVKLNTADIDNANQHIVVSGSDAVDADGDNDDDDEEQEKCYQHYLKSQTGHVQLLPNSPYYALISYIPDLTGLPPIYPGQRGMLKISALGTHIDNVKEFYEPLREIYGNRLPHYIVEMGSFYRLPFAPGRISVENMEFDKSDDQQEIKKQLHGSRNVQKEIQSGNGTNMGIGEVIQYDNEENADADADMVETKTETEECMQEL